MNDLMAKRFGRLTVICDSWERTHSCIKWACLCDCGNFIKVESTSLTSGQTRSCGCLRKEACQKTGRKTKHGYWYTRLYRTWSNMKTRCYNPNFKDRKYYSEKGITICDEWKNNFINFRNWALKAGYASHLIIDRINNNGNYEPSNCRFITRLENAKRTHLERRSNG